MNSFSIARPRDFAGAAALLQEHRFTLPVLKAGGMDVLDHLKEGLLAPDLLIDIRRLRSGPGDEPVARAGDRLRIEAGATLSDLAASALLRDQTPVIGQAVEGAATPQVRNVASAAGNLLQRPRCWYYRHEQFNCLKKGGSQCFATDGENKFHAVFGPGPCHIVHPSNLAPALHVCDGVVHLTGGKRSELAVAGLYHMPDKGILSEHNLEAGEVVTHITCTPAPRSGFYAIKEKQSFDWPMAMAAVALELDGAVIKSARVCAGAVAPVPWALPEVERALAGVSLDDDAALRGACAKSADGAKPMSQNKYKLRLLPVAVRRAVLRAAGRPFEPSEARP